jgi:hypothetical protein
MGFYGRCSGASALLLLNLSATDHTLKMLAVIGGLLAWGVHRGDLLPAVLAAFVFSWMWLSTFR